MATSMVTDLGHAVPSIYSPALEPDVWWTPINIDGPPSLEPRPYTRDDLNAFDIDGEV